MNIRDSVYDFEHLTVLDKMNFFSTFILICVSICCADSKILKNWGNVHTRPFGIEEVIASHKRNEIQKYNFTFPQVRQTYFFQNYKIFIQKNFLSRFRYQIE